MIMRTWRGAVKAEDADRYLEHQARTGVSEYRETPGNVGVLVLRRSTGELIEVTTVSFWTSMEAVEGFAGQDPERAKFCAIHSRRRRGSGRPHTSHPGHRRAPTVSCWRERSPSRS